MTPASTSTAAPTRASTTSSSRTRRHARPPSRAGREACRGVVLGGGSGALRAASRGKGPRRVLLRVRRQVPPELGRELIGEPSKRLADVDFALGGTDFRGDVGRARELKYFPLNQLPRAISASRINVNIARRPHAEVYASSTSRLFELAAAGAAIVSNPYNGIERWFEPGSELVIAADADEAVEAYEGLLDDPGAAAELGRRARERVLEEHTFAKRARQLLDLVGVGSPSTAPTT